MFGLPHGRDGGIPDGGDARFIRHHHNGCVGLRDRVEGWWVAGAVLGVAAVAESLARIDPDTTASYRLLLCLLALATTAPLALANPVVAAVTVTAAGVLSLTVFDMVTVAGIVAGITAAFRCGRTTTAPALAVALGLPYLVVALAGTSPLASGLLSALVPVGAGLGLALRTHREDTDSRATQLAIAGSFVEHTARGERARIARELHDVVAHHISIIAVQAETARLTTPEMPAASTQRFTAIGDTARTALTEMRRLLGVLREDAESDVAQRQPQPGLEQLNDLLDEVRDATGAGTRLILHGAPFPLAPGVELAAYRIVQEALTNSRRHARGAAVDVELHYTTSALRLLIRDNGPGPSNSAPVAGHGLLGMRERASAVGGELSAGPAIAGGFVVEATLPAGRELFA
jgi:signal transduction histidine kinase